MRIPMMANHTLLSVIDNYRYNPACDREMFADMILHWLSTVWVPERLEMTAAYLEEERPPTECPDGCLRDDILGRLGLPPPLGPGADLEAQDFDPRRLGDVLPSKPYPRECPACLGKGRRQHKPFRGLRCGTCQGTGYEQTP